jgi:membrane protease YdiL (CAAX protease family)
MRPTASGSYFSISRAPRYSLSFALPLLMLYEAMAASIQRANGGLRNGADVLLKSAFTAIAGPRGPLIFAVLLVTVMIALIVRDVRRSGDGLRGRVFGLMLAESVVLAIVFGFVVGIITAQLISTLRPLAIGGALDRLGLSSALVISLGAGLYEELLFRVILVGALVWIAKHLMGWGPTAASIFAVLGGALVFSAFHYIGPYGDRMELGSFVFRTIAGLAFSGLYVTRGFGITAWTHALYDVFLVAARGS